MRSESIKYYWGWQKSKQPMRTFGDDKSLRQYLCIRTVQPSLGHKSAWKQELENKASASIIITVWIVIPIRFLQNADLYSKFIADLAGRNIIVLEPTAQIKKSSYTKSDVSLIWVAQPFVPNKFLECFLFLRHWKVHDCRRDLLLIAAGFTWKLRY